MTVDRVQDQQVKTAEKPPATVQNEIQKELTQDRTEGTDGLRKELLALLSTEVSSRNIQDTAQKQIEKGFLDVKV